MLIGRIIIDNMGVGYHSIVCKTYEYSRDVYFIKMEVGIFTLWYDIK